MRKLLLVTAALVALAGPATAADLPARPVYKAPPAPPPVQFSWTGCSVGGHVGGLWARKDWSDRNISFVPGQPNASFGQSLGGHDADGWLGGVQAGCDYQLGSVVIGIQGDYAWTDAKGSNVNLVAPFVTDQTRVKSLATVTGRIGYAWERFLGYVKGGGAWERDEYAIPPPPPSARQPRPAAAGPSGRRRICLHQLSLGLRRVQLLRLRQPRLDLYDHPARQLHRQHQGNQERRARRPQRPVWRLGHRWPANSRNGVIDRRAVDANGASCGEKLRRGCLLRKVVDLVRAVALRVAEPKVQADAKDFVGELAASARRYDRAMRRARKLCRRPR